ncbi:hypothetical protein GCM10009841_32580 [Microlunatus panaciterrae]|uniref:HNH nuclease domain-containing protein n=1 Tax=Microlunatus panaciterrae TaxID=400768 RepID=A0ABS2RHB0_9ACTN|nr:HNH endonuclease signature motif containing protein [Microlunatus panaciterrae]MBM7797917.1 hypothetical protein [Microlunatus panaciterrae]
MRGIDRRVSSAAAPASAELSASAAAEVRRLIDADRARCAAETARARQWSAEVDALMESLAETEITADDLFHATIAAELEQGWSHYERWAGHQQVVLGRQVECATAEDPWVGVARVAPRPLAGVTGVCGPELTAGVSRAIPEQLSPAQLVELMTGAERLSRWAQGVQLAAVAAFAECAVMTDPDERDHPLPGAAGVVEVGFSCQREIEEFCSDGISAALGLSLTAAGELLNAACMAVDVEPVRDLLARGELDSARVRVMARELASVPYQGADAQWIDDVVAEHHTLTPRKLQRTLKRLVMDRCPDGHGDAHRRELANRGCWVRPKEAGMATFHAYLSADEATWAYRVLNAAAWAEHHREEDERGPCQLRGDTRSLDSLRADALMQVIGQLGDRLLADGDDTCEPSAQPLRRSAGAVEALQADSDGRDTTRRAGISAARVMLHVYMRASTVAGQDDRPAELLGYGPITADHARALVEDARLVRILTDPFSGDIRAVDTPSYRVPRILRWAMQARDRTCVFPTCDVPADSVQADHVVPHPFARKVDKALASGTTRLSNLSSLCVRHHRMKTHGGWQIQSTRGARWEWISPTGHSYVRNPDWGPPAGFWSDHRDVIPESPAPPF